MAIIDGLNQRHLTLDDIEGAVALSAEAGWNQTARDWQLMLENGQGFGLVTENGSLVATALTLPHGHHLAWISMVLVTKAFRNRGLATQLLQSCLDSLSRRSMLPILDATETGKVVYGKIGFKPLYGLQRWVRETGEQNRRDSHLKPDNRIHPINHANLQGIIELDRTIFGADRSPVLIHLAGRQPSSAFYISDNGDTIRGFIMARDGKHAFHIGPVIADDTKSAISLTAQVLSNLEGMVYIDALDQHEHYLDWLQENGFTPQRPFTRMCFGDPTGFDQPGRIFTAIGPELG